MDTDRVANGCRFDVELLQEIGKGQGVEQSIDHQPHRALGRVGTNIDDGPGESGILHARHGDQHLATQVAGGFQGVRHIHQICRLFASRKPWTWGEGTPMMARWQDPPGQGRLQRH
jgi:hypothetical protein